ncbi:hypothetical protein GOARA_021_00540 [Gordonia araii NBRC 100433]|uniref:DUF559 domain-containing protein n=1 Tax=Gordonia araii NBRC 100433 TaxID=1073574 RepID=G7GYZ2_9ACTN|nr:hypothetical protein GOARA_021_00540 [Gordonia araii NBRC 100433]
MSPGVYVTHTGPMTWRQRAWAAVLGVQRAALSHQSAVCLVRPDVPRSGPIHIAVGRKCRAPKRAGVVVHRYAQIDDRVLWNARPPRVRIEHAVLDLAAEALREVDAIAHLADAVQARLTTVPRLQSALAQRSRLRRSGWIAAVLADIADGSCSVLERGYLRRVERAHGLPRPRRQAATTAGRRGFRDVDYPEWGLVIELDGRAAHDDAHARDRDLERDLDAAVSADRRTLRLGWGQVYGRPCSTARKVARMLQNLGWSGTPTSCPKCANADA